MRITLTFAVAIIVLLLGSVQSCQKKSQDYVQEGNELSNQGKRAEAELSYRKAIQGDANNSEAYFRLGNLLLQDNKTDLGFVALAKANDLAPQNREIEERLTDVTLSLYLGRAVKPKMFLNKLENLAKTADRREANSFQGARIQGFLLMTEGKYEDSVLSFQRALQRRSGDAEASLAILKPLIELNRMDEAEGIALAAIDKNPNYLTLYDPLYILYLSQNRASEAEALLQRKVKNNPKDIGTALQLCSHFLEKKQEDRFETEVKRILGDKQSYPAAELEVSKFYEKRKQYQEATEILRSGLKSNPGERRRYEREILSVLLAQGKRDQALAEAEIMLKADAQNVDALFTRASLAMAAARKEDLTWIASDLKKSIELNEAEPLYRFKLGQVLLAQGDVAAAKYQFLESSKLKTDYLSPRLALAELQFTAKQYREVLKEVAAIRRYDPRNPEVRLLGVTASMGLGDYETARDQLTSILADYPRYPDAQLQMGFVHLNLKQYPQAERIFEKFTADNGPLGQRAVQGLIDVYLANRNGTKAVDLATRALQKEPDSVTRLEFVGNVAIRAGQYGTAQSAFEKLAARNPTSFPIQTSLAETYRLLGRYEDAEKRFRLANTLDPKAEYPLLMMAHLKTARGSLLEARNDYRKLLPLRPNDPYLLNNYAATLVETGGDLPEALRCATKAVQLVPDNASFKDTLGWIHAKSNSFDAANFIFSALVATNPNEPVYLYHYGYTLFKMGQKELAKKQLTAALSKQPKPAVAENIRQLLSQVE